MEKGSEDAAFGCSDDFRRFGSLFQDFEPTNVLGFLDKNTLFAPDTGSYWIVLVLSNMQGFGFNTET